jgi:hypothetical protein
MNMTNVLQIKIAILSQLLDRFITIMNSKHYNITTLWFLDDDDRMKMTIDLTEFMLKAMTHDAHRRRGR